MKKRRCLMMPVVFSVVLVLFGIPGWAENSGDNQGGNTQSNGAISGVDENALFGGSEGEPNTANGNSEEGLFETPSFENPSVVENVGKASMAKELEKSLLTNNLVRIGGKYHFYTTSVWSWTNPDFSSFSDTLTNPDSEDLSVDLGATLYFDARPDENFRVFGKTDISYPFSESADSGRSFDDIVHIRELFSDFNWKNILFFRGGKQVINWGVGYFFSPADIVNLSSINPEDPEAELEGPLALKVNFPFGIHNAYLYLIDSNATKWDEITVAPKLEFVIYDTEIGIGGVYEKDKSPEAMVTLTTSISDFNVFGESVLSYGSDKKFVEEVDKSLEYPLGLEVVEKDDQYFYSGTVGVMYNHTDEEGNFSYNFALQYYYNGYGYDDQTIFKDKSKEIGMLIANGELSASDISMPGKHYGAFSATWKGLLNTDFDLSLFWIGNLSDGSGKVTPAITYNWIDRASIGLSFPFTYGEEGYQFSKKGDIVEVSLKFSFGSGNF